MNRKRREITRSIVKNLMFSFKFSKQKYLRIDYTLLYIAFPITPLMCKDKKMNFVSILVQQLNVIFFLKIII